MLRSLSAEHATIMTIAAELDGAARGDPVDLDAALRLRWRLSHLLATHLAKEDKLLYPRLLHHHERRVALLAAAYQTELGGLASEWNAYMLAWDGTRIVADPGAFRRATTAVLALLERRVAREEYDLYPLLSAA